MLVRQGKHAEVVTALAENIEGAELHLVIVLTRVKRKSEMPSTPSTTAISANLNQDGLSADNIHHRCVRHQRSKKNGKAETVKGTSG